MNGSINIYSGATLLADGSQAGGMVSGLKVNGQGVIQVQEFFRATQVSFFARGNKKNRVSFTIDHLHADLVSSLERVLTESDTLPEVADFKLVFVDPDGTALTATLSSAGWNELVRESIGVTSRKTYTVTGGTFATSLSGGGVAGGLNVIDGGPLGGSIGATATAGSYDGGNFADNMALDVAIDGGSF